MDRTGWAARRPKVAARGPGLRALPAFRTFVRTTGVVPLSIAVEVYLASERCRYEVDLLDSALQLDWRAGRLPAERRVSRSARFSHGVDSAVARGDLSPSSCRCLEVIAESNGLTALDLAPLFRGVGEGGSRALDPLVQRGLVAYDHRTATYRPRLEAFVPMREKSDAPEEPAPVGPNPGLRTSVLELLNAAEARAACPLCGKPMPPGLYRVALPGLHGDDGKVGAEPPRLVVRPLCPISSAVASTGGSSGCSPQLRGARRTMDRTGAGSHALAAVAADAHPRSARAVPSTPVAAFAACPAPTAHRPQLLPLAPDHGATGPTKHEAHNDQTEADQPDREVAPRTVPTVGSVPKLQR